MVNFLTSRVRSKTASIISLIALLIFLPLLLLAVYETAVLVSRALGTPANIVVDTKATLEPIAMDFYHAFSQAGGSGTAGFVSSVGTIRSLRPRIIRLDHLYDGYGVVGGGSGNLTFDWSRLDPIVDAITATGARPMLVLSYMPGVIARDGNIINPPNNWNDWATVVQRTIEHYSGKSGKNLGGVLYECWNEPDLAQFGGWKLSGDKNYLTLYKYCSAGANQATNVNGFSLGGPATANLNKGFILSTLGAGRINFLSWHTYQYDPKKFDDDQRNLVSWLIPYPNAVLIPKYITEFGFTGDKSTLYGSTFAAAHAAAVLRQLVSGGPQFIFSFQLKDATNETNGWGLLTADGKPKPRYWVYNFLDTMAGTRLALTGEGSWVTGFATTKDNVIRILLVNYDSRGGHTENVPVSVTNLDAGTYTWRERFLFGRDAKFTETASDSGTIARDVFMSSQSVGILELTKQ